MDARAEEAAVGTVEAIATVERLRDAINARDLDGVLALLAEDCTLAHTLSSRGAAVAGRAALQAFWATALHAPARRVELEDLAARGGRCAVRWRVETRDAAGLTRELRGTAIVHLRDGRVVAIEAGAGG